MDEPTSLTNRTVSPFLVNLVLAALIVSTYFHFRANLIDIPLNRDEGGFAFFGRLISQGGTLYRDGVDHKPPGIWFIYAGLSYVVPFTAQGLHWTIHIYNLVTLALFSLLSIKLFDRKAAFWATLVFAVVTSGPDVEGSSASAEMFMLLPLVASFLFCIMGKEKNSFLLTLLGGVFSGMAFWIKQPAVLISVFVVACVALMPTAENRHYPTGGYWWLRELILPFSLGFLIPSVAILVYIWYQGTWDEFIYWAFLHNLEYASHVSTDLVFRLLKIRVGFILDRNPLIWTLAIAACVAGPFVNRTRGLIVTGFFLSSLLAVAHSWQMYRHYFALICPSLSLAAGLGISHTIASLEARKHLHKCLIPLSFAIVVVIPTLINGDFYISNSPAQNSMLYFDVNPFPGSPVVADYLRENTEREDRILILGSEPQILVLAGRRSATRHPFFYQVVGPYERSREFQQQVLGDIEENRPEYIVAVHDPRSWLADPKTSEPFIRDLNVLLDRQYRMDAIVVPDPESARLISCEQEADFCTSFASLHKTHTLLYEQSMTLYRRALAAPVSR